MSARRLGAILVVCLLVAGFVGQSGSPTPPGITEEGITDTTALVEAHTDALESTSFTVTSTRTMRGSNPEFAVTTNRTWHLNGSPPVRGYSVQTTTASGVAPQQYTATPTVETYRNGTTTVERSTTTNGSSIRSVDLLNSSVRLNSALHRPLLYELTTRKNVTVDTVQKNGTELHRVSVALNDTGIRSNASLTLFVTKEGIVRELRSTRTVRYRSGPRQITHRVRFSEIGTTTVDPPAWMPPTAGDNG
jgi:hypothetical protein